MSDSSINLSGKLDEPTIALYSDVDKAVRQISASYLIVGASARDLLFHHAYGIKVLRATGDTDYGVQVANWEQFDELRQLLIDAGYEPTRMPHRMMSSAGLKVDIVPFGNIEDERSNISWPPEHHVVMNVLGFEDALNAAIQVRLSETPKLDIPIASTAGMSLLKIIAWTDRAPDVRRKDAKDLLYLTQNYEKTPEIDTFEDLSLLEQSGYDITQVGSYLLGKSTAEISGEASRNYVRGFLLGELKDRDYEVLIDESLETVFSPREANETTLKAFSRGYLEAG